MSKNANIVCPHCGKALSNPDKLGWHLSRECPALISLTSAHKDDHAPAEASGKS
jgi:hypothetical protein